MGWVRRFAMTCPSATAQTTAAPMARRNTRPVERMMPEISVPAWADRAEMRASLSMAGAKTSSTRITVTTDQGMCSMGS